MNDTIQRFKFSVEDFYALSDMGVFADRHIELIDGDVIEITINPSHAKAVTKLQKAFLIGLGQNAMVYSQNPLDLGEPATLPGPDLMIIKRLDYLDSSGQDRHPYPDDVHLLIEVSDTTLLTDQTRKHELYAKHNISEYWIADLKGQNWFVHMEPVADTYRVRLTYPFGEAFAPLAFPKL